MDRLDEGALAELAGVGTDFVAEVVRLGLVAPETTLEEAGLRTRTERVDQLPRQDRIHPAHRSRGRRGGGQSGRQPEPDGAADRPAPRRRAGEGSRRWGDVPLPGSGFRGPGRIGDGRRRRPGGFAAGLRRHERRAVFFRDGGYYGRTVNMASRIAGLARPGEVLVSRAVVESTNRLDVVFHEVGAIELRGVGEPARLWSAHRAD